MGWREKLQAASFRGVAFQVEESTRPIGRRLIKHEFPGRDIGFSEDVGKNLGTFSFTAFIVGEDYTVQRDKLLDVCDQEGPGELIHPYYGSLTVNCDVGGITETSREGGMCRLSLTFVVAGEKLYPAETVDVKNAALDSIDSVEGQVGSFVSTHLSTSLMPSFIISGVANALGSVVSGVLAVYDKIPFTQELAVDLPLSLQKFQGIARAAIGTPLKIFENLKLGFAFFKRLNPSEVLKYVRGMFGFAKKDPPPRTSTPHRIQESKNALALNTATRILAATSYAHALLNYTPGSVDEALTLRAPLLKVLDSEMEALSSGSLVDDDDLYLSLQDLRTKMIRAVPQEGTTLPQITEVTLPKTLPALVVAFKLYGSIDMEADILDRNNIENPCFVVGDQKLEVLTSARQR